MLFKMHTETLSCEISLEKRDEVNIVELFLKYYIQPSESKDPHGQK